MKKILIILITILVSININGQNFDDVYSFSHNEDISKKHDISRYIASFNFSVGIDDVYAKEYECSMKQCSLSMSLCGFYFEAVLGKTTNDFWSSLDEEYATQDNTYSYKDVINSAGSSVTYSRSYEHDHYLKSYQLNWGYIQCFNLSKEKMTHRLYIGVLGGLASFSGDEHTFWHETAYDLRLIHYHDCDFDYTTIDINNECHFNYGIIFGYAYKCLYIQGKIAKYSKGISIGCAIPVNMI